MWKVFIMYTFHFTILPIKEGYRVWQVGELPFCAFLPDIIAHLLYIKYVKFPQICGSVSLGFFYAVHWFLSLILIVFTIPNSGQKWNLLFTFSQKGNICFSGKVRIGNIKACQYMRKMYMRKQHLHCFF